MRSFILIYNQRAGSNSQHASGEGGLADGEAQPLQQKKKKRAWCINQEKKKQLQVSLGLVTFVMVSIGLGLVGQVSLVMISWLGELVLVNQVS